MEKLKGCDCPQCRPPLPFFAWLESISGLFLTLIVLAAFVAGMWALFSLWGMEEVYREVTTAGKG